MTKEEVIAHVERWQKSNETKRHYCKKQGITYGRFQYWCRKLTTGRITSDKKQDGHFVLMQTDISGAEVVLPNGILVRHARHTDVNLIKELYAI